MQELLIVTSSLSQSANLEIEPRGFRVKEVSSLLYSPHGIFSEAYPGIILSRYPEILNRKVLITALKG